MAERSLALLHDLAAEMLPAEMVRSTTAYHWSLVLQLSSDYAVAVGWRPAGPCRAARGARRGKDWCAPKRRSLSVGSQARNYRTTRVLQKSNCLVIVKVFRGPGT